MREQKRLLSRALLGAMVVMAGMMFSTMQVSAQLAWNPPCTRAIIVNFTACPANVTLWATPANLTVNVPPCLGVGVVMTPPGTVINGVVTLATTNIGMVTPAPVLPPSTCGTFGPMPTAAANAWVPNVTFGPAPGCCFDVYFYQNSDPAVPCHIFLTNTSSPPPCTP